MSLSVKSKISNYLYFGYIPPENIFDNLFENLEPDNTADYSPITAGKLFDSIFNDILDNSHSSTHIIPLSAGYDSRAILAALLQRVSCKEIKSISYGQPGLLDYDIAKSIASTVGIEHTQIDLRQVDFSWPDLLNAVKRAPWTYVPDNYFNYICRERISTSSDSVWIGFLGDVLAGNHVQNVETDILNSRVKFINGQRKVKSFKFSKPTHTPGPGMNPLPNCDDYFDIGIRQTSCVGSIVLPLVKWDNWGVFAGNCQSGAKVITPFADRNWARYWLNAPIEARRHEKLFLNMLYGKFPKLFELPSKHTLGANNKKSIRYLATKFSVVASIWLSKKLPLLSGGHRKMHNYLDFNEMFRTRKDYQQTALYAFEYLNKYDISDIIDIRKIWNKHISGKQNCSDAILTLIGLAANLSVEESEGYIEN